ncbi:polysaccharide pyruvyl transferase family protein [Ruegeria arenilitoris]|uniref:polysaccharide pyruvyl transferase family protein n=1 Tax=Ruegeria arenilitoris TaxID=1173585 RepID=UPI00147ECD15|nr:polysaccharide pyruvyl transferase family protein [Ruegeria arenilitoris]
MEQSVPQKEADPIKLFWWNKRPNFGDDLSHGVVAHVSGRPVVWAKPVRADLFAIGSIMSFVSRGALGRGSPVKPFVWGSGCLEPLAPDFVGSVQTPKTVRGPITAALLNLRDVNFGDPGILASRVYPRTEAQDDVIGIVPHHSEVEDPNIVALVVSDPRFRLIDTRRPADVVCAEIAGCARIFSSSLHGLIVADSYGVANHWFTLNEIHRKPGLKFYDYATGIERALPSPLSVGEIAKLATNEPPGSLAYQNGIEQSQSNLLESFSTIPQETELYHA